MAEVAAAAAAAVVVVVVVAVVVVAEAARRMGVHGVTGMRQLLMVESGLKLAGPAPLGPVIVAAAMTGKPVMKPEPEASRPLIMISVAGLLFAAAVSRMSVPAVNPRRWSGVPASTPLFCT